MGLFSTWRLREFQKPVILSCIQDGIRTDGRGLGDARAVGFRFSFTHCGHAEVTLGATRVLCIVSGEVVRPVADRPNEGSISFNVDLSPMASRDYDTYPTPGSWSYERAAELAVLVERVLKRSRAIDTEALNIEGSSKVWALSVELRVLDDDGNITDAAALAALAGLLHFRRKKEMELRGSAHESQAACLPPTPISIHHMPVVVSLCFVDPQGTFVVDPTREEEAIATGKISIAINQHQELCGIHKLGGQPADAELVHHAIRVAAAQASNYLTELKEALENHKKQRDMRRKNIWNTYSDATCPGIPATSDEHDSGSESLENKLPSQAALVAPHSFTALATTTALPQDGPIDVDRFKATLQKKRKKLLKSARKSSREYKKKIATCLRTTPTDSAASQEKATQEDDAEERPIMTDKKCPRPVTPTKRLPIEVVESLEKATGVSVHCGTETPSTRAPQQPLPGAHYEHKAFTASNALDKDDTDDFGVAVVVKKNLKKKSGSASKTHKNDRH